MSNLRFAAAGLLISATFQANPALANTTNVAPPAAIEKRVATPKTKSAEEKKALKELADESKLQREKILRLQVEQECRAKVSNPGRGSIFAAVGALIGGAVGGIITFTVAGADGGAAVKLGSALGAAAGATVNGAETEKEAQACIVAELEKKQVASAKK